MSRFDLSGKNLDKKNNAKRKNTSLRVFYRRNNNEPNRLHLEDSTPTLQDPLSCGTRKRLSICHAYSSSGRILPKVSGGYCQRRPSAFDAERGVKGQIDRDFCVCAFRRCGRSDIIQSTNWWPFRGHEHRGRICNLRDNRRRSALFCDRRCAESDYRG